MGFSIKAAPEDVSSGFHLASSMCLKPWCILGREHQALAPLWAVLCLASCFLLHSMAFESLPREGREGCHDKGCTHGNLCPSPKAWAVLTFHPDGSHQAQEVEAGWLSKAELGKLHGNEPYFIREGGCVENKRLLQILLEGVGKCGFLQ